MSTSSNNNAASGGFGLGMVLFLIFMILKLCNKITWSWWWVTCPLWAPLAILAVLLFIAGIIFIISKTKPKRRRY